MAFDLEGRSIEEMAHEFETPTGTIKRRLHVARNRLKEQLEGAEPRAGRGSRERELACV